MQPHKTSHAELEAHVFRSDPDSPELDVWPNHGAFARAGFSTQHFPDACVRHADLAHYYELCMLETGAAVLGAAGALPVDMARLIASFLVTPLERGHEIECLDPFNRWYKCTVLAVKVPNKISVHYQGWSLRWDETLNLEPDAQGKRVARLGTHTDGQPHCCQHAHCKAARNSLQNELSELGLGADTVLNALLQVGPDKERAVNWILDFADAPTHPSTIEASDECQRTFESGA